MLKPEIRQDRADSRTIRDQQEIPGDGARERLTAGPDFSGGSTRKCGPR
jgi:hypothetical protein